MMIDESEFEHQLRTAYLEGVTESRASFARDLRSLADDFTSQIFGLRQELRHALGLPKMVGPDDDQATLQ